MFFFIFLSKLNTGVLFDLTVIHANSLSTAGLIRSLLQPLVMPKKKIHVLYDTVFFGLEIQYFQVRTIHRRPTPPLRVGHFFPFWAKNATIATSNFVVVIVRN